MTDTEAERGRKVAPSPSASMKQNGDTEKDADVEKQEPPKKQVSYWKLLFHFATPFEMWLMVIGTIAGCGNGAALPAFSLVFGQTLNNLNTASTSDLLGQIEKLAIWFTVIGAGAWICAWIQTACWTWQAERQARRMRLFFFKAVLTQELAWYDKHKAGEMASRMSGDVRLMQEAIGEKVGQYIQFMSTFFAGLIMGLVQGYQLALVILGLMPFMALAGALGAKAMGEAANKGQAAYATAGGIADEVLTSIRTVAAFGGEKRSEERYVDALQLAKTEGRKKAFYSANSVGFLFLIMFGSYALAFWFGSWLIDNKITNPGTGQPYTGGDVVIVFFSVLMGAQSLGNAAPLIPTFADGRGAAYTVLEVCERESAINVFSEKGKKPEKLAGNITVDNVYFNYPSRPDVPILKGLSLDVTAGHTVALVGSSGCGKSTVTQLLLRFYDPDQGAITVDGNDLKELNVRWWRENVGHVGQEPVLFATTIMENLLIGKPEAKVEEVYEACKSANCYDFIMKLPKAFDTYIGEATISGGQKQRIAIARAILKNPRVLLLDEATSALDSENERIVQEALERLMTNRTTIVIAHRLSTIMNANMIYVLSEGSLVESGSHVELIGKEGLYAKLVRLQEMNKDKKKDESSNSNTNESNNKEENSSSGDDEFSAEDKAADKDTNGISDGVSEIAMEVAHVARPPGFNFPTALAKDTMEMVERVEEKRRHSLTRKVSSGKNGEEGKRISLSRKNSGDVSIDVKMDSLVETAEGKKDTKASNKPPTVSIPMKRVIMYVRRAWVWGIIGSIGSVFAGGLFPVFAVIFSEVLTLFYSITGKAPYCCTSFQQDANGGVCPPELANPCVAKARTDVAIWSGMFAVLGAAMYLAYLSTISGFGFLGEELTLRLREATFSTLLRQEIGFFDDEKNKPRVLAIALEKDAALVEGATTGQASKVIQTIATIVAGLVIAFTAGWKLTLVVLSTTPLLIFASVMMFQMMQSVAQSGQDAYEKAGALAGEAIANVRTVSAFTAEQLLLDKYNVLLEGPLKIGVRRGFISGFFMGFSFFCMFATYALGFWYGAKLIEQGELTFTQLMRIFMAIIFMAMGIGQINSIGPNVQKAREATTAIFALIDRKSLADPSSIEGKPAGPVFEHSDIVLKDVRFAYPTREAPVLKGLTLSCPSGKTTALVGMSGCGKSTVVALLLRFYDPTNGQVLVNNVALNELNLADARRQIGLVSQEPVLFATSIRENIKYGRPDASDEDMIDAARQANIHDFIQALPDNYSTNVGARGSQISGGQKQRIAIARAILRNPHLLLLDEATSALDSESEKAVQVALDRVSEGRTTVAIAHRLSTIRNAAKIVYILEGVVAEEGTYEELVAKGGLFATLAKQVQLT
mmetsp:Transcript_6186/g.9532  ORF Transcript_6186/g.9532 Transcript_6186/m.9532 type:complete len:1380 (+) Transcript_6186:167-4306(+)|eukprot:CAMPEP_0184650890 /NCGR_PEP_ID=MMETSP0308-20130426/8465_1 /TAXON_ID=38269 /ORGANISM="Gloeochaete witrockiana, Strain SAG 46.84" /LENGTH=1379 /DNA_ID=CAMNT_0027084737 /DNA_START=83 /DNA_END=4222 /DNA_ORIENTATION=+